MTHLVKGRYGRGYHVEARFRGNSRVDMVKLRVTGKSLAVTNPKDVVAQLGWTAGDYIVVESKTHEVVLRKVDVPRRFVERMRY